MFFGDADAVALLFKGTFTQKGINDRAANEYSSAASKPLSLRRESMILSTRMSSGERVSKFLEYVANFPLGFRDEV